MGETAARDEAVREVVRRYVEIWSTGDPEGLEEVLHPDFVNHLSGPLPLADYADGSGKTGMDLQKEYVRIERIGLDGGEETLAVLVDGDWAAVLYREWGTHVAEFMDMPASGKSIDFVGLEIYRIRDGKIAEVWSSNMWLEAYRQMGWKLVVEDGTPGFERV